MHHPWTREPRCNRSESTSSTASAASSAASFSKSSNSAPCPATSPRRQPPLRPQTQPQFGPRPPPRLRQPRVNSQVLLRDGHPLRLRPRPQHRQLQAHPRRLGIRVEFLGDLALFDEGTRAVLQRAMDVTAQNSRRLLIVCLAYGSTHEIVRSVQRSCQAKMQGFGYSGGVFGGGFGEAHDVCRASGPGFADKEFRGDEVEQLRAVAVGELLAVRGSMPVVWPQMSLRHLLWAVLKYQSSYGYLEKAKRKF